MNVKYLYDALEPRAKVWCTSAELNDGGDGTYTFKVTPPVGVGTGSEIVVIDTPGLFLYYDATAEKAYAWTGGGN